MKKYQFQIITGLLMWILAVLLFLCAGVLNFGPGIELGVLLIVCGFVILMFGAHNGIEE